VIRKLKIVVQIPHSTECILVCDCIQMAEYIKQQVLEFESHLAAATSKQQITESTSLLISQLTRMEPT